MQPQSRSDSATSVKLGTRAVAHITHDDARAWCAEHGFDADEVAEATIRIGPGAGHVSVWVEISFYLLDHRGHRYFDPITDDAATGLATIPLRSWPKLTSGGDTDGS